MLLKIGKFSATVSTLEEGSRTYAAKRDEWNYGSEDMPPGKLTDGKKKYRISYNGRVWLDRPYKSGDMPIYDPFGEEKRTVSHA